MSRRIEQVAATLKREIGRVLAEGLSDPRVRGMLTVTEVEVSKDRRQAVVSVSVLPEDRGRAAIQGLRHARRHIQNQVAERIRVRQMPRFEFKLDESLKHQARVIDSINEAQGRGRHADPSDLPEPGGTMNAGGIESEAGSDRPSDASERGDR